MLLLILYFLNADQRGIDRKLKSHAYRQPAEAYQGSANPCKTQSPLGMRSLIPVFSR